MSNHQLKALEGIFASQMASQSIAAALGTPSPSSSPNLLAVLATRRELQALAAARHIQALQAQQASQLSLGNIGALLGASPSTLVDRTLVGAAVATARILQREAMADAVQAAAADRAPPALRATLQDTVAAAASGTDAGSPGVFPSPPTDPNPAPSPRKRRGGVSDPFPCKLHRILSDLEGGEDDDVVAWLPHGRAFVVRKPKEFVSRIMPKYFRMSSLSSFQRQINLYKFKRVTEGRDKGAYYHELFLRGRPELTKSLKRTKCKRTAQQAASAVAAARSALPPTMGGAGAGYASSAGGSGLGFFGEPDFYSMPPVANGTDSAVAFSTGVPPASEAPSLSFMGLMRGEQNARADTTALRAALAKTTVASAMLPRRL